MGRGERRPAVAPGIYPDALGYEARAYARGKTYTKRFPLDHPMDSMKAWQSEERAYRLRCRADEDAISGTTKPTRGTWAGDVLHYLQKRMGRSGYKSDRSHLAAWGKRFGTRSRHKITPHDCERQIGDWLTDGIAPKTIRHRARVFKELFHALDGPATRTPVDRLKLPPVPKTLPVPVDDAIILQVADSLKAGLITLQRCGTGTTKVPVNRKKLAEVAYARFLIRAISGQRPSQIGTALPEDIDRVNRIWYVKAGKGGNPIPFPLTDDLDLAFRYFDSVGAWGKFDPCSFAKTLRRHGWPAGVDPYRLRHSFAIGQLLAGVDLGDLQGLLGHTNPTTTRRYAPVLVARLKQAIEKRPLKLVKQN